MSLQCQKTIDRLCFATQGSDKVCCCPGLPKFLPTMACQVGLYFLSNSFLMKAAMSFSTLYFSNAYRQPSKAITVDLDVRSWNARLLQVSSEHTVSNMSVLCELQERSSPSKKETFVTCVAQSMASCCMSSDMSAFLITAFLSDMVLSLSETAVTRLTSFRQVAKSQIPLAFQLSVRNYMHYFWAKYNNWL